MLQEIISFLPGLNACTMCALEWAMSENVFKKLQRVSATKRWNYFYKSNTIPGYDQGPSPKTVEWQKILQLWHWTYQIGQEGLLWPWPQSDLFEGASQEDSINALVGSSFHSYFGTKLKGSLYIWFWPYPIQVTICFLDDHISFEHRKKGSKGNVKPQCSTNQFLPRPFHACKVA